LQTTSWIATPAGLTITQDGVAAISVTLSLGQVLFVPHWNLCAIRANTIRRTTKAQRPRRNEEALPFLHDFALRQAFSAEFTARADVAQRLALAIQAVQANGNGPEGISRARGTAVPLRR
jgi:hypothetical protein